MELVKPVLLPFAVVTAACTALAAVLGGVDAALGAAAGGALVGLFLGSSPVMLEPVARRSAALSLPVALVFFLAKVVSVGLLVVVFLDVGGIASTVDRQALGLTAMVLAVVWTALQVRGFLRLRQPAYDLGNDD